MHINFFMTLLLVERSPDGESFKVLLHIFALIKGTVFVIGGPGGDVVAFCMHCGRESAVELF